MLRENIYFRIESEYFAKKYLQTDRTLRNVGSIPLGSFARVTDGEHGSPDLDDNSGIIYLSGQNVLDNRLNLDGVRFCSKELHNRNARSALVRNNVLISIVGTVGNSSVVYKDILGNTDRNVATIKDIAKGFSPYFISTFLNCKFGRNQTERFSTGNVQPLLNLLQVKSILIPQVDYYFQTQIENVVKQAHSKLEESKVLCDEAENLLLDKLGLRLYVPSRENTAVKSLSDSFLQSGRLDAEYYHPEKSEMLDWLDKFQGKSIGYYASLIDERIDPTKGFSAELVSNYDLTDALEIYLDTKEQIPAYELGSTKQVMKKGDVAISRLRSYLKEIAIVETPEEHNVVGSSEFIVLRPNDEAINAETLLVYLRSLPVQVILKWCQSGSNHPRFMDEDLLAIKIPDRVLALQQTIKIKIREAISRSRESKRLLETAKRAVEIAIEENEQEALGFIHQCIA